MKWVLIAVGLTITASGEVTHSVTIERVESLRACFYTGERLKSQFERMWERNTMSFSCAPGEPPVAAPEGD